MYCPQCEAEYRAGFTRCADCDVDLVANLPVKQHPDDFVPITAIRDFGLIMLLKTAFKEAGVEFFTQSRAVQEMNTAVPHSDPLFQHTEFWVRAGDVKRALQLVSETTGSADAPARESTDDQEETPVGAKPHLGLGAAIVLNLFFLPSGIMMMAVLLGETERWPQPSPYATLLTFAVPLALALVTCVAWVRQMKIAPLLQLAPMVVLLVSAIREEGPPRFGVHDFNWLNEYRLPIIAALLGALGLVAILFAAVPRILNPPARR
jgi:hypothetical protein